MYHLYEAVFESPRMWLKVQVSSMSQDQAMTMLGSRLGSDVPSPNPPEYSLSVPFSLSERFEWIANWKTISEHLPDGWDEHEFRLAEGPYPWCETLSDDCDCHGSEGRLDALYCSDLGLGEDSVRRAGKTTNVRHFAWRQMMGRDDPSEETYDEEHLRLYRSAVLRMVKSARELEQDQPNDYLYMLIKVDRKNPRAEGTLTTVQRDLTDPTGNSQRTSISRYSKWEVCLGIIDGLMDV